MSKLLFDESPLVVQPTLAKAIGLNEAIILQQIHYWMQSKSSGRIIEDAHWIFNSLSDWQEQFPWWSEATIYRTLQNLEDAGLVKTGNFNQRKGDRTKWYTLNYAVYTILEALIEQAQWREEQEEIETVDAGAPMAPTADADAVVPADETEGERNSIFQNEPASCQNETTLPENSSEISFSLSSSGEPKSEKQQTLETLEREFAKFGGFVNPLMIERFCAAFDANTDHRSERLQNAIARLNERRNFFSAVDAYREWREPKPFMPKQSPRAPSPYRVLTD